MAHPCPHHSPLRRGRESRCALLAAAAGLSAVGNVVCTECLAEWADPEVPPDPADRSTWTPTLLAFADHHPPSTIHHPPAPRPPCLHLGAPTGALRDCPSCRGTVRLKLFACAHPDHDETTLRECAACPDWEELPVEEPRGSGVRKNSDAG